MTAPLHSLTLADQDQTEALARQMAPLLRAGDVLLLSGSIGAGKSTFARAVIRAATGNPAEDVPSPTFTLVQSYETPQGEIWHSDLYRLGHPDEVFELGLYEAFETAICLVEWPDRLGDLAPETALALEFTAGYPAHQLTISGDAIWAERLSSLALAARG